MKCCIMMSLNFVVSCTMLYHFSTCIWVWTRLYPTGQPIRRNGTARSFLPFRSLVLNTTHRLEAMEFHVSMSAKYWCLAYFQRERSSEAPQGTSQSNQKKQKTAKLVIGELTSIKPKKIVKLVIGELTRERTRLLEERKRTMGLVWTENIAFASDTLWAVSFRMDNS